MLIFSSLWSKKKHMAMNLSGRSVFTASVALYIKSKIKPQIKPTILTNTGTFSLCGQQCGYITKGIKGSVLLLNAIALNKVAFLIFVLFHQRKKKKSYELSVSIFSPLYVMAGKMFGAMWSVPCSRVAFIC